MPHPGPRRKSSSFFRREPGKTEILAGGTDLVGLHATRVVQPHRVVNMMEIPEPKELEAQLDGSAARSVPR